VLAKRLFCRTEKRGQIQRVFNLYSYPMYLQLDTSLAITIISINVDLVEPPWNMVSVECRPVLV